MNIRISRTSLFLILLFWGCSETSPKTKEKGKFEANWESLRNYQTPEWFADAKFGIFIHWGVYSVPEFESEWYPRLMYSNNGTYSAQGKLEKQGPSDVYKHHLKTYGALDKFGYKNFIPMFKAENFNPDQWMAIFKEAGAKYVISVADHHDGFAMYKSNTTRWNAVNMGPKRDVIGELKVAAKKFDLHFGVSSHYAFNWDFYPKKKGFDTVDPEYQDLYQKVHKPFIPADKVFLEKWWKRTTDLIDNYQPEILWFDFCIDKPEFAPYHPKLAAYYYNKGIDWGYDVILQTKNFNFESFPQGTDMLDIERGKLSDINKDVWQTDTSIGKNSWGYVSNWISKSPDELIVDLVDIISKNGCLLLNIGPKKDGTIPQEQVDVLLKMGKWLKVNGEAVYGTRPWEKLGEGPTFVNAGYHSEGANKSFTSADLRFVTSKKGDLFVIVLEQPIDGKVLVTSLINHSKVNTKTVKSISLLGSTSAVKSNFTSEGLELQFDPKPNLKYAIAFKITLKD